MRSALENVHTRVEVWGRLAWRLGLPRCPGTETCVRMDQAGQPLVAPGEGFRIYAGQKRPILEAVVYQWLVSP
jgi:hypothetical protein